MTNRCKQYFYANDKLGKSTSLTFRGKKLYGTLPGGIATRIINFGLVFFWFVEIFSLAKSPQYT